MNFYLKMGNKIKICFVAISSYPIFNPKCNKTFGGAEVQIYNLSKELAKNKSFDVSVVVGDFGQDDIEIYDDVKVVKSFSLKKNFLNYILGPIKLFLSLKKSNPEIVICRAFGVEVGISSFFCKLNKKKFIYSVACDNDINGEFIESNGLIGKIFDYGLNNTNEIIFQNQRQVNLFKKWSRRKLNFKIINSGYEILEKRVDKKNFILWVGRSDSNKRPELFIKLAKNFPNHVFLMIMPKSSDLKNWKKYSLIAKKIPNLKFIEKVPFCEIQKYFDQSKVFINTSKYEGFPNTFIQSGLGATPILSLNVNPDNFIENNKIGFFCENNFDYMVEKLNLLLNNKKIYNEFSKNIFNYVEKNHNIKILIKKWENEIIYLIKK